MQPGQTNVTLTRTPLTVGLPAGTWTLKDKPAWLTVTQQPRVPGQGVRWSLTGDAVRVLPDTPTVSEIRSLLRFGGPGGDKLVTVTWPLAKATGTIKRSGGTISGAAHVSAAQQRDGEQSTPPAHTGPGRVIIEYRAGQTGLPLSTAMYKTLRVQESPGGQLTQVIEVDDVAGVIARLRTDPQVRRVLADGKMRAAQAGPTPSPTPPSFSPGDALAGQQWQLQKLGYAAVLADQPQLYPNAVTVAVIDSGIRALHPDLAGRIWADGGLDLAGATPDTDPTDPAKKGSHGTAVAGLIVANQNAIGIAGGTLNAPVKALAVRVIGDADGDISTVMLGLRYAAGESVTVEGKTYLSPHPAQVVNMSLGVPGNEIDQDQKDFICSAVTAATARGALVVAAAGNTGKPDVFYPAACPGAVAVGGLNLTPAGAWQSAPYSATGPQVTLAAPGGDLTTAYNKVVGGKSSTDGLLTTDWVADKAVYRAEEGTSFAAPTVSAVAALMLAKGITKTPAQTAARLTATALDVGAPGRDNATGSGVVDPVRALGLTAVGTAARGLAEFRPKGSARVLRVQADDQGNWTAYLSDGTYTVRSGPDSDGNGVLTGAEITSETTITVKDPRKP